MEIAKLIKDVKNLNGYISLSQELLDKYKNAKIQFNMSSVLSLKNIRSLEIEYFNKCDDKGVAFIVLERMLSLPPSKIWNLLGKEVISLIQYWLEAVRKHLINHHPNWWTFMHHLLNFIKELLTKDPQINNILVETSTDCLLDLATRGKLSVHQRYEVLHTVNLYCADCSKEIRLAKRSHFEHYFIRLATIMATCGHLPSQYSIMETLLRWLLPRHDQALRREVAAKWFPGHLYDRNVVDMFLARTWHNFFQDARDFLTLHNEAGELITSVICRKLCVGDHVLVSGSERRPTFVDLNVGSECVTIVLEPRALQALGVAAYNACYTLTVGADITSRATFYRESVHLTIVLTTTSPPRLYPHCGELEGREVKVTISSRTDLGKVHRALSRLFGDKYELFLDMDNMTSLSPRLPDSSGRKNQHNSDEDTRFSLQNKEVKRGRHAGYVVRHGKSKYFKSPSTASTTSLAQLHDKLEALPPYRFDKEPVSVCLRPELSGVTELTEEDFDTTTSTLKLRPCGVLSKTFKVDSTKKSQSDSEVNKEQVKTNTKTGFSDLDDVQTDVSKFKVFNRHLSNVTKNKNTDFVLTNKTDALPEVIDENSTSCLFAATVSLADQSVINDTLERLSKTKDFSADNIVDLLVQEAFQPKPMEDERISDSGINTGDAKKTQDYGMSETIEGTPTNDITANKYTALMSSNNRRNVTQNSKQYEKSVVSKSTSDESNTDAIIDTPLNYVSVRKRNLLCKKNESSEQNTEMTEQRRESAIYDEKVVEDFFSQHCRENRAGALVISPTLAKKINETSSESSDFDHCLMINNEINFKEIDVIDESIIDCLNDMVEEVCKCFEICSRYLDRETDDEIVNKENVCQNTINSNKDKTQPSCCTDTMDVSETKAKSKAKSTRSIKLTFKNVNKKSKAPPKKRKNVKNKLNIEPAAKMSTILEVNNEVSDVSMKNNSIQEAKDVEIPIETTKHISDNTNKITKENVKKDVVTPISRRKRKLYSPKDDHIMPDKDPIQKQIEEITETEEQRIQKCVTPKSSATCYKELEKDRLKYKKTRSRRSKTQPKSPLSPKSKKNSDVFDKLKEHIESDEKIILADKKAVGDDIGIYNFTSDSEDEDFRKKKNDLKSRISSTTVDSGNSMISTRRGRIRNKINYTEKDTTSNEEGKTKKAPRKKLQSVTRRQTPKRKNKSNLSKIKQPCLIDEKMRGVPNEDLDTSLIVEKPPKIALLETINPQILEPQVELIEEDIPLKDLKETIHSKKKPAKKQNKKENVEPILDTLQVKGKDDDRTSSPLPGLVVETIQQENNDNDSLTTNMIDKFKKIYQNGPEIINETNTTQNMLSENEKTYYSANMNFTDEIDEMMKAYTNINENKDPVELIEDSNNFDVQQLESNIIKLTDNKVEDFDDKQSVTSIKSVRKRNLRLKKQNSDIDSVTSSAKSKIMKVNRNVEKEKLATEKNTISNIKSKVDKKEQIEIISFDVYSMKNLKSRKNVKDQIEKINISDPTEMKSDKSIESIGITAHGVIDGESPPNTKTLMENVTPRELVDMDDFLKEYYMKLKRQVDYYETVKKKQTYEKDRQKSLSPVVSVKRVSSDEITKWQSNKSESKTNKISNNDDYLKWLPSRRNSDSDQTSSSVSEKAPSVRIERLSLDEMAKWLRSPKHNSSPIYNAKETTTKPKNKESHDDKYDRNKSKVESPKLNTCQRKSLISPIKLDDLLPKTTLKRQINITEELNKCSDIGKIDLPKSPPRNRNNKYNLRKIASNQSSPDSKVSTSTRKEDSRTDYKRRIEAQKEVEMKRRKIEVTEVVCIESGPSVSSVEDWFKKNQVSCSKDVSIPIGDAIQNIMERLDTTLAEIHQDTSKNFIHLFVEAQKQLTQMKEERMTTFRNTATAILGIQKSLKILAQEIVDLDQRSQEMEHNFTEWLKKQGAGFIREDSHKKRAMVALLQEDMQSILDNANRTTSE